MKWNWIWWLIGAGAVGGVGYYVMSRRPSPSTTGDRPKTGACLKDLPSSAQDAIQRARDARNVSGLLAFVASLEEMGDSCASDQVRTVASRVTQSIPGMVEPDSLRERVQDALARGGDRRLESEAEFDEALADEIDAVAKEADDADYLAIGDQIRAASKRVREIVKKNATLAEIAEDPDVTESLANEVSSALAAAKKEPKRTTVDALRALSTRLKSLGYKAAAREATDLADRVEGKVKVLEPAEFGAVLAPTYGGSIAEAENFGDCTKPVYALPPGPAPKRVGDSFAYQPSNIREWVLDALRDGGRERLDYTAEWLEFEAKAIMVDGAIADAYPYSRAAECVRKYEKPTRAIFPTDTEPLHT